jgi:opacity protein-like surface antigen
MMKRIAILCALAFACAGTAGAADRVNETPKADRVVGRWHGTLPNGMGGEIRVILKVQRTPEGAFTATMDSPDQNATDIPVAKITVADLKVSLDVSAVKGSYEGALDGQKDEISGTWRQSGQELPLVLKREAATK